MMSQMTERGSAPSARRIPMSFAVDGKPYVAIVAGFALFVFGLPSPQRPAYISISLPSASTTLSSRMTFWPSAN